MTVTSRWGVLGRSGYGPRRGSPRETSEEPRTTVHNNNNNMVYATVSNVVYCFLTMVNGARSTGCLFLEQSHFCSLRL